MSSKYQCNNCNITCYGGTELHLNVRISKHRSMYALIGKRVSIKKCAVKDHCLLSGQVFSFGDFSILNYESLKLKHLTKESLLFTKDKPLWNKQFKLLKFELFWFNPTYAILFYLRWFLIIKQIFLVEMLTWYCKQTFLTMGKVLESLKLKWIMW